MIIEDSDEEFDMFERIDLEQENYDRKSGKDPNDANSSFYYSKKKYAVPGVHIMMKKEAKLLRKLMSDTGMTEIQLRAHKKYRKMLSDAQKVPPAKKTDYQREYDYQMRNVTRKLKLAKEHPLVQAEFKKRWAEFIFDNPRYKVVDK